MPGSAPILFLQIDSFTRQPFGGNPAAVCLLETEPPADWMQHVAAEMNLSETAFTWPGTGAFGLRWFTPVAEVDLCGHATLAAAHALWETKHLAKNDPVLFDTRSGRLIASQKGDAIRMDFPVEAAIASDEGDLANALGSEIVWCGQNRMDYIVQLTDAAAVRECAPDLPRLAKLETRGVIITALADNDESDFVSRFFCPGLGIDEDPVTGSAHCCLAPFWAERLGKTSLTGHQVSQRGGVIDCELAGDRVLLVGHAVTVLKGQVLATTTGA